MNAYVIYADESDADASPRWSMYTVPGVDSMANDDRVASLYRGPNESDRRLIGVVRLSKSVSVILANQPPQLGGFTEIPKQILPPRPVITSIDPAAGAPAGGTEVNIQGENFLDTNAVFFGTSRAQSFTVDPAGRKITAISPIGQDTVYVTVVTPGGTSAMTEAGQFSYIEPTPLAVVEVEPKTGQSTGGETIRVGVRAKAGLIPQAILFGSTPASSVSYVGQSGPDTHQLTVVTPPNRGDVHVTLLTQDGSSPPTPANVFSYVDPPLPGPPTVSALLSSSGLVIGGDIVRIEGSDLGDASEVMFGSVPAESFSAKLTDQNTVALEAVSPCGVKGQAAVTVRTRRGTSAVASASQFAYSVPSVLGTVSFGSRAVGAAGAPLSATLPLQISLTDVPHDTLVPHFSLGDGYLSLTLQALLQGKGLGPQFTVGQFVAAFGNVTFGYAIPTVRLRRGEGRDFTVQITATGANSVTVSANFTPITKGYRADVLHASVGGVQGSGTGLAGFSAALAAFVMNQFTSVIDSYLAVLLVGTGT
jgi:hypothetical protein